MGLSSTVISPNLLKEVLCEMNRVLGTLILKVKYSSKKFAYHLKF